MSTETRTDESPHLTVDQLADRWHTTPQAIYNRRGRGTAPPGWRDGAKILFPLAEVEKWEADRLAAARTPSRQQRPPEPKLPRRKPAPRAQSTDCNQSAA